MWMVLLMMLAAVLGLVRGRSERSIRVAMVVIVIFAVAVEAIRIGMQ